MISFWNICIRKLVCKKLYLVWREGLSEQTNSNKW
jgi:hypothetical protein